MSQLETKIETDYVNYVARRGCLSIKCSVPGRRNWPDQQTLCGNGYSFFIEFKRKGREPRRAQLARHRKVRAMGYNVYVCDNLDDAIRIFENELLICEDLRP